LRDELDEVAGDALDDVLDQERDNQSGHWLRILGERKQRWQLELYGGHLLLLTDEQAVHDGNPLLPSILDLLEGLYLLVVNDG
jgi:hypothetical protein